MSLSSSIAFYMHVHTHMHNLGKAHVCVLCRLRERSRRVREQSMGHDESAKCLSTSIIWSVNGWFAGFNMLTYAKCPARHLVNDRNSMLTRFSMLTGCLEVRRTGFSMISCLSCAGSFRPSCVFSSWTTKEKSKIDQLWESEDLTTRIYN